MKYAVVIEKGPNSFGAYVPDLPGCIAVGKTRAEALQLIREAIEFHLQGLQAQGERIPLPLSTVEIVSVAA
jgi:predicted RNase H-like HicB family nuclease